jgi:hypothetical protein
VNTLRRSAPGNPQQQEISAVKAKATKRRKAALDDAAVDLAWWSFWNGFSLQDLGKWAVEDAETFVDHAAQAGVPRDLMSELASVLGDRFVESAASYSTLKLRFNVAQIDRGLKPSRDEPPQQLGNA